MYGSQSVVRVLADAGLMDEYELLVHPIFVERGKPLFDAPGNLEFKSARTLRSGVVLLKYSKVAVGQSVMGRGI
jgi:dihydrofolate reductase